MSARRRCRTALVGALAASLLLGSQAFAARGESPPLPSASAAGAAVASEQAFSLALLRTLSAASGSNLVISPLSLESGLAMLDLGAAGATESGIATALSAAGQRAATLAAGIGALRSSLNASADVTLDEADAVFANAGFSPRATYLAALRRDFAATLHSEPFATSPMQAVAAINRYVQQSTNGLIPVLFPAALDPATRLALVDAVYLNAKWAMPFAANSTAPGAFYLANGATVQTPYLNARNEAVGLSTTSSLTAVELPYLGGRFAALVLEPTSGSLTSFVASLTPPRLAAVVAGLRQQSVALALPRASLSSATALNGPLTELGMGVAFTNEADLSGITVAPRLQVSIVRQVATLRIDEAGTTAAAATGIGLEPTAIAATKRTVVIDHPFIFFVRDEQNGALVFAAMIGDPATS